VLFLFAIIPHFLWLHEFPVGINHDEVDVFLSAKSYLLKGSDVSGVRFPQSLVASKTEAGLAGLPSFLMAPLIAPFSDLLLASRLVSTAVALLISLFISLIIWEFTKNKRLSLISFFISLISPWLFFYSRSPTEAPWALLFSLIGIYMLFNLKGYKALFSISAFAAAFYSYQGAKIVLPPMVFLLLIIKYFSTAEKVKKFYAIYFGIFIMLISLFFIGVKLTSGGVLVSRSKELTIFNIDSFQQITNDQRRVSIDFPGKYIYFNKYTNFLKATFEKYLNFASPNFLFLHGEQTIPFAEHGVLYLVDSIFILLGLLFLQKRIGWFISTLFLVAPIAASLSVTDGQYIFRAFMLAPAFIILISIGIEGLMAHFKNKWLNFGIILILVLSFLNFLMFFFFRYSVDQQENHFLSERIVASYINRNLKIHQPALLVSDSPNRIFYEYEFLYGFSSDLSNFVAECPKTPTGTIVTKIGITCENLPKKYLVIQNQKDAGTMFKIYSDKLCSRYELKPFRENSKVSDYNIEKMNNQEFCERWIETGN